jgi:hypothetical protein
MEVFSELAHHTIPAVVPLPPTLDFYDKLVYNAIANFCHSRKVGQYTDDSEKLSHLTRIIDGK